MMNKLFFFLTLFTTIHAFALSPNLEQIRGQYKLPALGAAIIHNNAVNSYISGLRKWGNPTLATTNDQFHLGSDTKAMTATLVAIFVERGLLKWDSTLDELFPELSTSMSPEYKKVTIAMLTAHRSGVTGDLVNFDNGRLWQKISNPKLDVTKGRKIVTQAVLTAKPAYQPGSKFEYSNGNYIIVGAILGKISGKTWETLITQEIFQPLGMSSCGFGQAGHYHAPIPDQPWGHQRSGANLIPVFQDNPATLGPAGTVHCSMKDWAKFIQLHLDGFNGKSTSILKANSFKKLHQPYPGQDYTYGGWARMNRDWANGPVLTHAGSNTLNYAVVWLAPRKNLGLISVTNIGDNNANIATDKAIIELISMTK